MVETSIGIDDIAVYVPHLYLNLNGEFTESRKVDPRKLASLGVSKMGVPDSHEDSVTMAANAALKLIKKNNLSPEEIGRIHVGTETQVDHSKPVGSYVLGCLEKDLGEGSLRHCLVPGDAIFACLGASGALLDTLNWIRAGANDGKAGIVIATDIAKYETHSSGEYTQGAGAVAMLVRENPTLLSIERPVGVCTKDERDFFKPLHRTTPVVDGKYSNRCYLDTMKSAFVDYRAKALRAGLVKLANGEALTDHIEHLAFHQPYPKMTVYAAAFLFRHEWRGLPRWQQIVRQIGYEPGKEHFQTDDEFWTADDQWRRRFTEETDQFKEAFNSKVQSSQEASRIVGNIYTGSMYLGFASMLEYGEHGPFDSVGFGSYGSGCGALAFRGTLQHDHSSVAGSLGLRSMLEQRREVSLEQYGALHEGKANGSIVKPHDEFALVGIGKEGCEEGLRFYEFVK